MHNAVIVTLQRKHRAKVVEVFNRRDFPPLVLFVLDVKLKGLGDLAKVTTISILGATERTSFRIPCPGLT